MIKDTKWIAGMDVDVAVGGFGASDPGTLWMQTGRD
jgi:hypothetical protein